MLPSRLDLDTDAHTCAAVLFDTIVQGDAPPHDDPVLTVLHWHARQYMHGVCTLMAIHLNETRGLPVILLEGRHPGEERWQMRHAAVGATLDMQDLADGGYDLPVIDAAGAGTFRQRLDIYDEGDREFQLVWAAHSENPFSRRMAAPREPRADIEDHVRALPGLCLALGIDFDLRASLRWIIANAGTDGHLDVTARDHVLEMLAHGIQPTP